MHPHRTAHRFPSWLEMDFQKSLACQHTSRYMAIANPWFVFVEFVLAFQSPISSRYIYRSPLPQKEETCKNSDVPHARMTTRTLLAVKNSSGFWRLIIIPLCSLVTFVVKQH